MTPTTAYGKCSECQTFERLFRAITFSGRIAMLCPRCYDRNESKRSRKAASRGARRMSRW